MKKILSFIFLSLIFFVNAQSQDEWVLAKQKKGISIYTKEIFCDAEKGFNRDLVLFKMVNSTNAELQISFKLNRWINGICLNCNLNLEEYYRTYSILPNQTIEGSCLNFRQSNLSLFVKFNDDNYNNTDPKVLTEYTIENLTVVD